MNKRAVAAAIAMLGVAVILWRLGNRKPQASTGTPVVLRISHFLPSIPATVQKARGNLERRLAPLGVTVQWNEFTQTTDSILALSSGAIDLSVGGLEGGLAAIASGVPLRIAATGPHVTPKTGWYTALLVPDGSPIKTLADLRGKKIAVGRGGFAEAVLAVAVRKGGLSYPKDVQPEYVSSADGAEAFSQRLVDAVLTLDPYVPSIQRRIPSHVLTDNERLGYRSRWSKPSDRCNPSRACARWLDPPVGTRPRWSTTLVRRSADRRQAVSFPLSSDGDIWTRRCA